MIRLDNTTVTQTQSGQVQATDTDRLKARDASTRASESGSASVSASVSTAGSAVAQAAAGSDVRTDKVAALQAAISDGTYSVSAGAVADKVLESLLGGR